MDVPTNDGAFSTPSASSLSYSSEDEFVPQSGFELVNNTSKTVETNTTFSDFNPGMTYDMGDMSDNTYGVSDDDALSLNAFLARPIRLYTINWTIGTDLFLATSPWQAFLTQTRVVNRISNFKNLRGRLHLKFMVNGSSFYYGLIMASYVPLPINDEFQPPLDTANESLVLASQNPHIYIDPTNSVAGTMVCPFFWQYNAIDLTKNDAANLGNLIFRRIVPLSHANGGTDALNITVLAWMTDVTLSAPTALNAVGMVPQGGDEYGDSPNSLVPTVLTKAMGLTTTIMKYARASQMVVMGAEAAMKVLGFCRPIVLSITNPMRPTSLGNLANVNLGDAVQKLTLDAKQEVVIDPRTLGLKPDDEMNIVELAKRESFICTFSWSASNTEGTALHYHNVTPLQCQTSGIVPAQRYALAPSAWVALPFAYWRGTMMFRFKIVASAFHKGRLRISYDPSYSQAGDQMNVTQNHIVDIAECKDFCLKIGWNQPRSYLDVGDLGNEPFSSSPIITGNITANGSIKVEVLNELSLPSASSDPVTICVFTSMCDDFEVQGPDGGRLSQMMFFPQSGFEPQSGVEGVGESLEGFNAPCMEQTDCQLAPPLGEDETPNIYFGEKIKSWRACLKRFNFHSTSVLVGNTGVSNFTRPTIPNYRGRCPTAVNQSSTVPYNYSDMTLFNWVIPAYAGMRGGVRHKFSVSGTLGNAAMSQGSIEIVRAAGRPGWSEQFHLFATAPNGGVNTTNEAGFFFRKFWSHTWPGAMQSNTSVCPTVEVEIPYQDNRRFWHARRTNYDVPATEVSGMRIDTMLGNSTTSFLQQFVAAGDDFGLYFFLNTPMCYVNDVDLPPLNS